VIPWKKKPWISILNSLELDEMSNVKISSKTVAEAVYATVVYSVEIPRYSPGG
jgi:hypothetical protein